MGVSKDYSLNSVPATGQISDAESVTICEDGNAGLKILFLGNSITRHAPAPELGWHGDWGMAASARHNDYVHRLIGMLNGAGIGCGYCIANLSEWERLCYMSLLRSKYKSALEYPADIAVIRLGENARLSDRIEQFEESYAYLACELAAKGMTVICTDLFWENTAFDGFIKKLAEENNYGFVEIHDLGNDEAMKAVGRFENVGVAVHPGDRGMEQIARRLFESIMQNRCIEAGNKGKWRNA